VLGAMAGFGGYALAFFLELPVGAAQTVSVGVLAAVLLLGRFLLRLVGIGHRRAVLRTEPR
jgi:hypothetical protein